MQSNEVLFKNFTKKDFTWPLAGKDYTFEAGSVTPMTAYEATHFTKHLVDQVLNDKDIRTNDQSRTEYEMKCIGQVDPTPEPQPQPDGDGTGEGGAPVVHAKKEVQPEEAFEGLKA